MGAKDRSYGVNVVAHLQTFDAYPPLRASLFAYPTRLAWALDEVDLFASKLKWSPAARLLGTRL